MLAISGSKNLSWCNPTPSMRLRFVPLVIAGFVLMFRVIDRVQRFMNPPPYYSDFKDSIQIVKSNLNWVETAEGPRLFVTGILTNQSQIAWRAPEFECRFYNPS